MSKEPIFLSMSETHELCRFPSTGEWSLRFKDGDDRAHIRYLNEFEVQFVETALAFGMRSETRERTAADQTLLEEAESALTEARFKLGTAPDVDGLIDRLRAALKNAAPQGSSVKQIPGSEQSAGARPADAASPMRTETRTVYGWLIENGEQVPKLRYRTMRDGLPAWTEDHNEALRFSRRIDAERFAEQDEDAWRIAEHGWDE